MLDDRPYMKRSNYRGNWSGVTWLLGILVVVFFVQKGFETYGGREDWLRDYFFLSPAGIHHGYVWQFLTFQFFHANFLHILCNGWAIYLVGRQIEEDFGTLGFWKLYLISGVAGGVLQLGLMEAAPRFFNGAVLGASAGASGLLAAFAVLHPEQEWMLFPFPFTVRAITLLWIDIGIALFGIVVPSQTACGAHLGGILYALGYVYWGVRGNPPPWRALFGRARVRPAYAPRTLVKSSIWKRTLKPEADQVPREFMSEEVDPILDKISALGIHSLTERERKILEAARDRMAKRP